jgi:hypothetical protein
MRDREERRLRAEGRKATGGAPVKLQLRGASSPNHLDVTPEDLLGVTGSERLHRRFLCGEATGKMDRGRASALAVGDFTVGENTAEKSITVPFDCRGDARDIGRIETKANDCGH